MEWSEFPAPLQWGVVEFKTCSVARTSYIVRQIVLHHGLPFDVKLPNAESRKAMRDIETGEGLVRSGSAEDLFRDLGI